MRWNPKDVVGYDAGDMVKYLGCTDDKVSYGQHNDPRFYLDIGSEYEVERVDVYDYHTDVVLVGYSDMKFNSVCFE